MPSARYQWYPLWQKTKAPPHVCMLGECPYPPSVVVLEGTTCLIDEKPLGEKAMAVAMA